jgi:hypothetical protein
MAASNMVFTSSASGRVPIVQLMTSPSKQSITGDRYRLPAGMWNSVMSVNHFSFGADSVYFDSPMGRACISTSKKNARVLWVFAQDD